MSSSRRPPPPRDFYFDPKEAAKEQRRLEREAADRRRKGEAAKHSVGLTRAAEETEALEERFRELTDVLIDALAVTCAVDFDALKVVHIPGPPAPSGLDEPLPAPELLEAPRAPGLLSRLMPRVQERYLRNVAETDDENNRRAVIWRRREVERQTELTRYLNAHTQQVSNALASQEQKRAAVDDLIARWSEGQPEAIAECAQRALQAVPTPRGVDLKPVFQYDPAVNTLVGRIDIPDVDIIPTHHAYRYVKTRSAMESIKKVTLAERNALYERTISSLALCAVHSVYSTDTHGHIPLVVINCIVDTTDKATGKNIREVLISVPVKREEFAELELAKVDPRETLKWLNAKVSPKPYSYLPVQPVLEFQMVDKRFIDAADVISGLSHKMNLMDLTPNEFEDLVTNLYSEMGFNSISTSRSYDGGVDSLVYYHDPVFGGKVIVQSKQYSNKVGPAAVRELIGSLDIEKANKAILVTTAEFTDAAKALKADYENIELINGNNLLQLLKEYAGIDARIDI